MPGGARRPEQERRGVQAVDAGLNVADVPAFLGLASQRNELQRRIVHRCQPRLTRDGFNVLNGGRLGSDVQSFSHIWFGLSGARHWLKR